jgi:limonene-1,2-epoxide hydrolase
MGADDNVPFPDIIGGAEVEKFHRGFGVGATFLLEWKLSTLRLQGMPS